MVLRLFTFVALLISFNAFADTAITFYGNNQLDQQFSVQCTGPGARYSSCAPLAPNSSGNNFYTADTGWISPWGHWSCYLYRSSCVFADSIASVGIDASNTSIGKITITVSGSDSNPVLYESTN